MDALLHTSNTCCRNWRRVDAATKALIRNATWMQDTINPAREALLSDSPDFHDLAQETLQDAHDGHLPLELFNAVVARYNVPSDSPVSALALAHRFLAAAWTSSDIAVSADLQKHIEELSNDLPFGPMFYFHARRIVLRGSG